MTSVTSAETKRKLNRLKLKAILKLGATGFVLVGGIVTGVLFPNPISAAVTLGCARALAGGEGIKHTIKRYKKAKILKREAQMEEKIEVENELVEKVKRQFGGPVASAPSQTYMYPNLNPIV